MDRSYCRPWHSKPHARHPPMIKSNPPTRQPASPPARPQAFSTFIVLRSIPNVKKPKKEIISIWDYVYAHARGHTLISLAVSEYFILSSSSPITSSDPPCPSDQTRSLMNFSPYPIMMRLNTRRTNSPTQLKLFQEFQHSGLTLVKHTGPLHHHTHTLVSWC